MYIHLQSMQKINDITFNMTSHFLALILHSSVYNKRARSRLMLVFSTLRVHLHIFVSRATARTNMKFNSLLDFYPSTIIRRDTTQLLAAYGCKESTGFSDRRNARGRRPHISRYGMSGGGR